MRQKNFLYIHSLTLFFTFYNFSTFVVSKTIKNYEEETFDCPSEDDPLHLIFFPSKIQCDWYYLCSGGKAIKLTCAPGFHWNQAKFQCDTPENANCQVLHRIKFYMKFFLHYEFI